MPSLHQDPDSPFYRIRFRYNGRNINRSLRTRDKRRAAGICSRVDETLRLLNQGRITIPSDVNPVEFVLSDGRATRKTTEPKAMGLIDLFAIYKERLPVGRKEETTLKGERIHFKHFKRHLGPNRLVQSITKADLQDYAAKRLIEKHHGKPIQPDTVKKELVTFRMLWNWSADEGLLTGPSPTKQVVLPLTDEKPPFMTRSEIEAIVSRGGLTDAKIERLWKSLYLAVGEVTEILDVIKAKARYPFIYPMMVFVAHTGARRSEMVRSQVEDIDFRSHTIMLREKKKSRTKAMTYRRVDMSPLLYQVMREWLTDHLGGQMTFCQTKGFGDVMPITAWQARHHMKKTLVKTEWKFLKGFHVFRHSFASNLAAASVDQRVIDEFMGHQTEEMRRRYRHLFPGQRRAAINAVFGDDDSGGDARAIRIGA